MRYTDVVNVKWLHKVWLRVLAIVLAAGLVVIGVVSVTAAPLWPLLGVAVATVAVVWSNLTSRLDQPTCLHCGRDLCDEPGSQYGIVCPGCGGLNEPVGERLG